jgi:hypothetical protein
MRPSSVWVSAPEDWQFSGVGNFGGIPGETSILLAEPIEKPFAGSREAANLKARTMINAWLKSREALTRN